MGRRVPASVVGPRLRDCGHKLLGPAATLCAKGDVAYFGGVVTCGLVWVCPECGPRIRQRRAQEIADVLVAILDRGHGAAFGTFTVAHRCGQPLRELMRWQERAWRAMRESRAYRDLADQFGLRVVVCTREPTWGTLNGWHPHRHVAFMTERPLSAGELHSLESGLYECWRHQLERVGLYASREHGAVLRPITSTSGLGSYLAKVEGRDHGWTAALELARSDLKLAGAHSHTVEQVMVTAVIGKDAHAFRLAVEYIEATRGRKMMTWGTGIREEFAATVEEASDAELAAQEEVGGVAVAVIGAGTWRALWSAGVESPLLVLEACERGGPVAVRDLLDAIAPGGDWCMLADDP